MRKAILAIGIVTLLMFAGNAFATPTIDGTNSFAEWTSGLVLNGFDSNEGLIADTHDISRVAMFQETAGGGAGDGLYILTELFGTPTWTALPTITTGVVVYGVSLDLNADGDVLDAVDRIIDYRLATGITLTNGLGAAVAGAPTASLGSVVEMFVPSAMFGGFPMGAFNTFSFVDNGGSPPDDFIPDRGFNTTIPEPSSMALLGIGLFGLVGGIVRKKRFTA